MQEFLDVVLNSLSHSWMFFMESSPYMLLGLFAALLMQSFIPQETMAKHLMVGKFRSVLKASLLGIPIPMCSCGVVPASFGLKKQGANNGAVLSFLISTPETGVDSIFITYALIDPVMTVLRPVAALITAICAGVAENFLGTYYDTCSNITKAQCACQGAECQVTQGEGFRERFSAGLRHVFIELIADIGKWYLVGIILAGIIYQFLSPDFIKDHLGGGPLTMLIMLIAGIPFYVCATASTPIAAALILNGLSPGAALVFLLSGPATNITTLTVVAGLLGKRTAFFYLSAIVICSLAFGFATDFIYKGLDISPSAITGTATELFSKDMEIFASILLVVLILHGIWRNRQKTT